MKFDTDAIRAAHPLPDYLEAHGHELRRAGSVLVTCCPVHEEKTPSFTVTPGKDAAHCFGCGFHGDVIALDQAIHGDTFTATCERLEGSQSTDDRTPLRPKPKPKPEPVARPIKWPADVRRGTMAELETLARLRRINLAACCYADAFGTLLFGTHHGHAAWILTDPAGRIAEARRMDGQKWPGDRKALALKNAKKDWPLGCVIEHSQPGAFKRLAIVEGGPDYLAAFHMADALEQWDVLPVAIMGREVRSIRPEALKVFRDRCVRVFPHVDPDKPGAAEAFAKRWAMIALEAGAAEASSFNLGNLTTCDDNPVSDLNDAIQCRPEDRDALAEILTF